MQRHMNARAMRQQPFAIYDEYPIDHDAFDETYDHRMSTSPSPYDADNGLSSDDNDSVLPSIETASNTRKSSAAFTSVSSIPPSLPYDSNISPYTPRKGVRPAFRSPSSVRAMQMSSPPPFQNIHSGRMGSPLSARRARAGTPSSIRSGSVLHNARGMQDYDQQSVTSQGQQSRSGTPSMQHQTSARGQLVLLHVTVLPSPGLPYSMESLQEHAPSYIIQNWYMLQEKLTETVLSRGVLIPHPGEEFDLLEESLLETLGLYSPRISSCGHFHASFNDSDNDSGNDSGVSGVSDDEKQLIAITSKPSRWSTLSDLEDTCHDCAQPIRVPGKGIGSGNARWDIKVYASNGLLSSGAWFAAHREMERVDVEIEPWIPEDVRRALDAAMEKEQDQLRKEQEELEKLKFDLEVMQRLRADADDERAKAEQRLAEVESDLEHARQAVPPVLPALTAPVPIEDDLVVPKKRVLSATPQKRTPTSSPPPLSPAPTREASEIPLSTLLRNYLILLAQDRRNIVVGVLSVLVILMSLRLSTTPQAATNAVLSETMAPQFGNSILMAATPSTSESRHATENMVSVLQSSLRAPLDTPVSSGSMPSPSIAQISSASSDLVREATQQPLETVVEELRPKLEGAAISHSSDLQQSQENEKWSSAQGDQSSKTPLSSN